MRNMNNFLFQNLKPQSLVFVIVGIFSLLLRCASISDLPLLIVVSFDGFRHDYVNKVSTPNLHKLMDDGVTGKWMKNAFVTKTFPNHYSIATGFFEETHGIVGNEMYDPVFNEKFYMDNRETKWWDNDKVIPIWVANQLASPIHHSGGMMWAGTNVVIHNQTAFYYQRYRKRMPWKDRVDTAMSWITNDINPANCILLYFEEPDFTGHDFGPDSKEVERQITRADNLTDYLVMKLEELKIFERTNLIILSDHGMSSVPESHLINMDDIVNSSLYEYFGSSPVWNILPAKGQKQRVYSDLLEGSKTHNYKVYLKEDIPEEYHYQNNRRILDILLVADVGWGLTMSGSSRKGQRGQHGYNNSSPEMWPIFIAHGPAFRHNYTSRPFYNVDVYPLMCHLLQIKCIHTNGSLFRVWNMLHIEAPLFSSPSLPTSYITGIVILLVFCVVGGITVIIVTTVKQQRPTASEFDMQSVLPYAVRTDKQNASFEEEQKLLNGSFDPVFDD